MRRCLFLHQKMIIKEDLKVSFLFIWQNDIHYLSSLFGRLQKHRAIHCIFATPASDISTSSMTEERR